MRVTAIVVAWNSLADLPRCLAALEAQDHAEMDVVVVDNASSDGTADWLRSLPDGDLRHPRRLILNATNRGFAGGVNDGLAASDAEAVLLVNPDVVAAPEVVRRCVAALSVDPRRGSIQPRLHRSVRPAGSGPIIDTTGHRFLRARLWENRGEGEVDVGQYLVPGEVFGVSGALALHRRSMLDEVAWRRPDGSLEHLTEDLFAYFDDVELDLRARLHGWVAWYEPTAVGVHERGGAGPRRTPTVEALNWANRLLVVATCDDRVALRRAAPLVAVTTLLKTIELTLTTPRALLPALRRLRALPRCRVRRHQLLARATVSPAEVVARWEEPFRFGPWIATWWRRVTGRAPGRP
jgi:GT2 family glycosyltransferase